MILQLEEWIEAGIQVGPKDADGASPIDQALQTLERVVLDLHAGDAFERDHKWITFPETFVLRPGESTRLRTHERLETPNDVFGLLCSRASLAAQGLYVSNIKVDPCFSGNLEVAVCNGGAEPVHIRRGSAFASVFFCKLVRPLPTEVRREPTPTAGVAYTSWKEQLRAARPHIITGVLAFTAAVAAALILHFAHL